MPRPLTDRFPQSLAVIFCVFFIALGIDPVSRQVWIAEVIPVVAVFLLLVLTYRRFRFSNTAYGLMGFWLFWHTVGGHYTFANVPFGAVTELLGGGRNHFDRIGHFSVGFYAWPIMELLIRKYRLPVLFSALFGLFSIMSIAAAYEIIEWWYAALEGGSAGIEFLGSQGDIWDAQKDMLADTLGAVTVIAGYLLLNRRRSAGP
jgi:putative membrane protein